MKNEEQKIICFKKGSKVIYFCDSSHTHHFVPDNNWIMYLKKRYETPVMCHIENTVQNARSAALEYYDHGEQERFLMERPEFILTGSGRVDYAKHHCSNASNFNANKMTTARNIHYARH